MWCRHCTTQRTNYIDIKTTITANNNNCQTNIFIILIQLVTILYTQGGDGIVLMV